MLRDVRDEFIFGVSSRCFKLLMKTCCNSLDRVKLLGALAEHKSTEQGWESFLPTSIDASEVVDEIANIYWT